MIRPIDSHTDDGSHSLDLVRLRDVRLYAVVVEHMVYFALARIFASEIVELMF